ncbi:hypothetical protein [Mucilaginibacter panaciglaebae]|uniref:hypothetical protein n=1 Tax=Mucilaginibacter panaciglaebae TaxID=502331 RepID=UPI0031E8EF15
MLKRCLQIILAAWLINALICFHPVFSGRVHPASNSSAIASASPDNTLLYIFLHHYSSDKAQKSPIHHASVPKYRYLISRTLNFDIWTGHNTICSLFNSGKTLPVFVRKIWENKLFSPPHYNYLFRLSPF